jgi:hypothetical protein
MTLKLFLLSACTLDGDNMSTVVRAETPRGALDLYMARLVEGEDFDDPNFAYPDIVGFERSDVEVAQLADCGAIGILDWDDVTRLAADIEGALRRLSLRK